MYRRAQGSMGPAIYTPHGRPKSYSIGINALVWKTTRTEKEKATQQWGEPWNSSEPIENSFSDSKSYTSKLT